MNIRSINSIYENQSKNNSSVWKVDYFTTNGKRHCKGFKTKEQALAWIEKVKPKNSNSIAFPPYDPEDPIKWWTTILSLGAERALQTNDDELKNTLRVVSSLASSYGKLQNFDKVRKNLEILKLKLDENE